MTALLASRIDTAQRLRSLVSGPELVVAPGAYDCLSARLVEAAGFSCVYMTGFGTAAAYLGRPDVGFLGMSEMVDHARRIVQAVGIPVIADADTGYGNPLNVVRTVQMYEEAGVAAIHIEDQVAPKKCGHIAGKQVIPADDMEAKIRAAISARRSADFTIIARTDARAVEGLDAALERAHRYREAGADAIFVEAPETEAEIRKVAESLKGTPLLFNWVEGGRTPPVPLPLLRDLGFRIVIFPVGALLGAASAIRDILAVIARDGTPAQAQAQMMGFDEFLNFIGLPEIRELERRFT